MCSSCAATRAVYGAAWNARCVHRRFTRVLRGRTAAFDKSVTAPMSNRLSFAHAIADKGGVSNAAHAGDRALVAECLADVPGAWERLIEQCGGTIAGEPRTLKVPVGFGRDDAEHPWVARSSARRRADHLPATARIYGETAEIRDEG